MSSETGTPWRVSRSRTACRACGTEASTAGAVNRQTPSYGSGPAGPVSSMVRSPPLGSIVTTPRVLVTRRAAPGA